MKPFLWQNGSWRTLKWLASLGMAMVMAGGTVGWAQVRINEVLADNAAAVDNGDDFPDYIELYNNAATPANLAGMRLTDDLQQPFKFVFPSNTVVAPFSYFTVWADDRTNSPGLHTGFGLNNKGDSVYLFTAAGFFSDSLTFGLQLTDLSLGRVPDGTGAWTLNLPTHGQANRAQPLAAPDRLVFNEWAALNTASDGVTVLDDWLEIYNATNLPVSLGGLLISDTSTNHPIPNLSFIGANEFLEFTADDRADRGADHLPFKLSSSNGETLTLRRPDTSLIDSVTFGPQVNNVSQGRLPDAAPPPYRSFPDQQRTPGRSNFLLITNVVINEVLSHTDLPLEDAVELYNPTDAPVDISYWWMSDDRDEPRKYQFPPNTIIPAQGFKVVYEWPGGPGFNPSGTGLSPSFTFNSFRGDEVNLFSANSSGNLLGLRLRESFGAVENGVSFGRVVTAYDTNFVRLSERTFGQDAPGTSLTEFRQGTGKANAAPKVGPIVVSEIMYHPPDIVVGTNRLDNSDDEFVELHNITAVTQPLYDAFYPTNTFRMRNAVDFDFPRNLSLPPKGFLLLVNFNPVTNTTQLAAFRSKYNVPTNTPIFGPYGGKLGNGGETIELKRPDTPQGPGLDFGFVPYYDLERIKYNDKAPWPVEADGQGASLQRIDVAAFGNAAENWAAGSPTPGTLPSANTPPVLDPIPDLLAYEHWPIIVTNRATDPDVPAQNLTYSLDPGAPPRASISTEGVFQWWTGEADGPGQHEITVRVTDDGLPNLSATQTFTVTLQERNRPPNVFVHPQYAKAGELLSFATAHDPDLPANQLTFTLEPGAPEGLSLNPTNGLVTWTPTVAQAPNTNFITIRVVDDGIPSLQNQQTYTIYVREANAVLIVCHISLTETGTRVSWKATVGRTYRVEYATSLGPNAQWFRLGTDQVAFTPDMSVVDGYQGNRFYRVLQLN